MKLHALACLGMCEGEFLGVQEVPSEIANECPQLCVLNGVVAAAAVGFIAYNRMLEPCKVNTNLVRAARFKLDVEQRESIKPPVDAKQR